MRENILIDLYAKKDFFPSELRVDEPVRGSFWLQGYLDE
jgi:hypothetical protein